MMVKARIAVIIPVLNEEAALGNVLGEIPPWVENATVRQADRPAHRHLKLFVERRRPPQPTSSMSS